MLLTIAAPVLVYDRARPDSGVDQGVDISISTPQGIRPGDDGNRESGDLPLKFLN